MKSVIRKLIPRPIRNVIRSPIQTIRWWLSSESLPVEVKIREGFSILCPRNAITTGFAHFQNDPDQITELDHFIRMIAKIRPARLLDIGCHYGMFCLTALHYSESEARALGVDASRIAGDVFQSCLSLNGMQNKGHFLLSAVGRQTGILNMVDTGVSGGNYLVLPEDHPKSETKPVPMTTIDTLLNELEWKPNIIKVDVEGFEEEVLLGGELSLMSTTAPICLELHNERILNRGKNPESVINLLKEYGYNTFHSIKDEPLSLEQIYKPDLIRFVCFKGE